MRPAAGAGSRGHSVAGMEWLAVVRRIEAGENRHTEFKRGLGDLSAVGRAMCAFANTEGGLIVLGVEDSKEITGVKEDTERVQERLAAFLQTGCSAPVHARTGRHEEPRGWVHWIEIMRREMLAFNDTEPELTHDEPNRFVRVTFHLAGTHTRR